MNQTVKDRVQDLLERFPHLKDDDYKLISTYWLTETGGRSYNQERSAFDFLQQYADGNLTPAESITRMRRKLQEENINLRGLSYQKRQDLGEEIRKSI
jgi:hypothetical protein